MHTNNHVQLHIQCIQLYKDIGSTTIVRQNASLLRLCRIMIAMHFANLMSDFLILYMSIHSTATCTEDTFTPTANRASTGATSTQGADSEALCKAKCLESAACLGFDLDTSANPQCWLILTQAILDSSATRQGPTQYLRVPCTAGKLYNRNY